MSHLPPPKEWNWLILYQQGKRNNISNEFYGTKDGSPVALEKETCRVVSFSIKQSKEETKRATGNGKKMPEAKRKRNAVKKTR